MKSVSMRQLGSAVADVQDDGEAGLWVEGSRSIKAEVFWCAAPQLAALDALGFFMHGTDRFQRACWIRREGHMYIPRWVLAQGLWQNRGSLRDVVRHEYGHAVAHYYPGLIQRSSRFRSCFRREILW